MKTSMFLSLSFVLFSALSHSTPGGLIVNPKAGSALQLNVDHVSSGSLTLTNFGVDANQHQNFYPGTKTRAMEDPILNAIIFEYCSKQCGDPCEIENAPCWYHCRFSFYLLNRRIRK